MGNIYYARRGNKILKIGEDHIDRYLSQGYTITDANGKVFKKGVPHDANLLTAEVKKQTEEIESLKAENARLTAELKEAKAEIEKFKSTPISEPKTRKRKQATATEEEAVATEE